MDVGSESSSTGILYSSLESERRFAYVLAAFIRYLAYHAYGIFDNRNENWK